MMTFASKNIATLVILFAASHASAFELEHWNVQYKIKGQEVAIAQSLGTSEGPTLSSEEAEALEPFLLNAKFPIVVFELDTSLTVGKTNANGGAQRNPSTTPLSHLLDRLKSRGAKIQILRISAERLKAFAQGTADMARFLGTLPNRLKSEARRNPPTRQEIGWGLVHTAYQGAIQGLAWFSSPGVPPLIAAAITVSFSALTAVSTIYGVAFDRAFMSAKEISQDGITEPDKSVSDPEFIRRRRIFNYIYFGLLAYCSGAGNPEVGLRNLVRAIPPLAVDVESTARIRAHVVHHFRTPVLNEKGQLEIPPESRRLGVRFVNLLYFVAFPMALLDMSGVGPTLLDLGFYQIRITTVGTLVTYLSFFAAIKYVPDKVKELLKLPEKIGKMSSNAFTNLKTYFSPPTPGACVGIFKLESASP